MFSPRGRLRRPTPAWLPPLGSTWSLILQQTPPARSHVETKSKETARNGHRSQVTPTVFSWPKQLTRSKERGDTQTRCVVGGAANTGGAESWGRFCESPQHSACALGLSTRACLKAWPSGRCLCMRRKETVFTARQASRSSPEPLRGRPQLESAPCELLAKPLPTPSARHGRRTELC